MAAGHLCARAGLLGLLTGLALGLATGTVLIPVLGSLFGAAIGAAVGLGLGVLEGVVLSVAASLGVPSVGLVALGGGTAAVAAIVVALRLDAAPLVVGLAAAVVGALGAGLTAPMVEPPQRYHGGRPGRDALVGAVVGAVIGLVQGAHDARYVVVFAVADIGCGALCGLLVTAIRAVLGDRGSRTRWPVGRHA